MKTHVLLKLVIAAIRSYWLYSVVPRAVTTVASVARGLVVVTELRLRLSARYYGGFCLSKETPNQQNLVFPLVCKRNFLSCGLVTTSSVVLPALRKAGLSRLSLPAKRVERALSPCDVTGSKPCRFGCRVRCDLLGFV